MPITYYKPTTPGRRHASVVNTSFLNKKRPEKKLSAIIKNKAGRNNQGKITVRHQGGGAKRFCRIIDYKRNKFDITGKVIALEYDPNRTAHIALIQYADGEKRYIIAPDGISQGDIVISSQTAAIELHPGNALPLSSIPAGMSIHNIELTPGAGGILARSAGSAATLQSIEGKYGQIKLNSGEVRLVPKSCLATIGIVGNADHRNVRLGKAGRKRHLGIRPTVTGKSMNPVDHPHGGGEGHQPIGLKHPKTPWGKPALGVKTRRKRRFDKLIVKRRKRKKKK